MTSSPQDFESSLWKTAEATARQAGLGIAPDCASHLREFVATGVARLVAEEGLTSTDSLERSRHNLVAFVEQMAAEAKAMRLAELHEPTFHQARGRLCPLWPFC